MGKASRAKVHGRGRTVRVLNDLTGKVETFHNVTVDDAAVEDWRRGRWMSVAQGYPNRPPDFDTPEIRGWRPRPGDPEVAISPLAMAESQVALFASDAFSLPSIGCLTSKATAALTAAPMTIAAVAKGSVSVNGTTFLARVRVNAEFVGIIVREQKQFDYEAEARAWVVNRLAALSFGGSVREVDTSLPDDAPAA